MSFFNRIRGPLFENTGSTARDVSLQCPSSPPSKLTTTSQHLASERTFLAWMRTGLGFIALGMAVERFSQLEISNTSNIIPPPEIRVEASERKQRREQFLVGALLGTGSGSIVYGITRYFSNLRLLEKGKFRPAFWGAGGLGVAVAGFAGLAYVGTISGEQERHRIRRGGGSEV